MTDHQEQHPVEAPLPQVHPPRDSYPPADNPLQPPEIQQLSASGLTEREGGESRERPITREVYSWEPEKCCCGPGCFHRVLMEDYNECCCVTACVALWFGMFVCCCVDCP